MMPGDHRGKAGLGTRGLGTPADFATIWNVKGTICSLHFLWRYLSPAQGVSLTRNCQTVWINGIPVILEIMMHYGLEYLISECIIKLLTYNSRNFTFHPSFYTSRRTWDNSLVCFRKMALVISRQVAALYRYHGRLWRDVFIWHNEVLKLFIKWCYWSLPSTTSTDII